MGRKPLKRRAMTGAERVALHSERLREAGGRRVTITLDAERAATVDWLKRAEQLDNDASVIGWMLDQAARARRAD
jgi:cell division inhibitor SulA